MSPHDLDRLLAEAPAFTVPDQMLPPASARPSAVLVLFGDGPAGLELLLIQRAETLRMHAGQPAFPGGAIDPGDAGPVDAALREAAEETGLDPSGVDVLLTLPDLYISRSGFAVTPVIGWWREPCAVAPVDAGEVASVAMVPIADLSDPANRLSIRAPSGHISPAFRVSDMLVWGFTAGMLTILLDLGGWTRQWDADHVEDLPPDMLSLAMRGGHPPGAASA